MRTRRILVIDDDPVFGQLLAGKGSARAFEVEYFPNLLEAVYSGRDLREFDAAVVDCVMPELSGPELVEYFRMFHADLPVVLVSRTTDGAFSGTWRATGARAFVAKRRGLDAILDTVQRIA